MISVGKTSTGSQTVARALAVLELLGREGELGVRELGRQLGVAPSIAQRLINTLAEAGFVEKSLGNSKWKIGYKAFQIGSAFLASTDLNAATAPELHLLAEQHQVNSFLGVLRAPDVVYLAAVQSGGPISITNAPGSRTYIHSTALGKALLFDCPDDEVHALIGAAPLKQLTKKTKRSVSAILKDLKEGRRLGYVICDEENLDNVFAVGAPIRDATGGIIAALSGAVPRQRLSSRAIEELCELVKASATRASRRLGSLK
ncbi:IclR family transcriptional regulator [Rhodopseudomonas sp. HC1]|uniref:IclR family transcriptional regulator n=1 Tax=Rhodopseudomonas infernalis TaxID=2897386 RepID=UPI001EE97E4E|nr:IclR family transcriptional regulator [Rhodopseudomonas infernalis]MCG6204247.1 IclR family transcriptional regulator [Rhodopseudomonas infernalis]